MMPIPKDPEKAGLWRIHQRNAQLGKSRNKGVNNPFFGKHHDEKTKGRISDALQGENNPSWGKPRPQYVKDAIGRAHTGKPSPFKGKTHTPEVKNAISERDKGNTYHLNKKHTEQTKKLISRITRERTPKGANHPRWKGGVTERYIELYNNIGYVAWRKDVFERDNYTCRKCGDNTGHNLIAHHIIPVKQCMQENRLGLIYDVDNGLTVCEECHKEVHRCNTVKSNGLKVQMEN